MNGVVLRERFFSDWDLVKHSFKVSKKQPFTGSLLLFTEIIAHKILFVLLCICTSVRVFLLRKQRLHQQDFLPDQRCFFV